MVENLNKIWSKSRPLSSYFAEKLVAVKAADADRLSKKLKETELPKDAGANAIAQALLSSGRTLLIANAEAEYRKAALFDLRNALIGGEAKLIGIEDGTRSLVLIDPDFWIGAEVYPETDQASSEQQSFRDLRIIALGIEGGPIGPSTKGPKSYSADRIEIILACIDEGLVDFNRHNLDRRFDIYLGWIKANRPSWNTKRGFGKKAFEAAEPEAKSLRNIS